ncbi:DUF4123 domain-containing protein [Stenotrophomonas sp.]|uniref:DUF4123 domain-containing protein n=1 Tax=Stenotrophomonas sp. TaxID=69392 RepID=UPI0028A6BD40|nr:DUF4123 domain-containing protein [Stenotrophomonas sp.]
MRLDHRFFNEHQFALINPLQMDRRVARLWPGTPLVPAELRAQQQVFPYLIDLRYMSTDERLHALDKTVEYAHSHEQSPFSALIASQESRARLRSHLSRVMVRQIEGEKMLFRYYDPRVWECLLWILSEAQLSSLLGPIVRWTAPLAGGMDWISYAGKGLSHEALMFDAAQLRAIASLASVNRVVARLNVDVEQLGRPEGLSQRIYKEIERARSFGLTDFDDLEAFAYISISESPIVHENLAFREAIDIAKADPGAYRSIVTNLVEHMHAQSLNIYESYGAR